MPKLEIRNVSKIHGNGVQALDGVDFSLAPGVHGLLGPNGAGKSTLMRILATVSKPTSGQVLWDGTDVASSPDTIRTRLGYLPQDFGVYPNLTAEEFLQYLAAVKGVSGVAARERIDALLELTNLSAVRRRRLGGFSGGMRQRVGICQALLNDPWLLIVDEPTAGLDPEERVRFANLLTELAAQRIVILSTHIVADVEAVAETLTLLRQGELLTHATPTALLRSVQNRVWSVSVDASQVEALGTRGLVTSTLRQDTRLLLRVVADDAPAPHAEPIAPSLLDAYLDHMNRETVASEHA